MKKILLIILLLGSVISNNLFAQNNISSGKSSILTAYYELKNALVAGNSNDANLHAAQMIETFYVLDSTKNNVQTREELLTDATHISKSRNISTQRVHFARLSVNMFALAKSMKLSEWPIYYDYCPMNKSFWLSKTPTIKNPYYGSSMLTCGKISEALK